MDALNFLTFVAGLAITIIGYFLKQTMSDLKSVKEISYETRSKLNVLENDYINKVEALNNKFDMLNESIRELTKEIKNMPRK